MLTLALSRQLLEAAEEEAARQGLRLAFAVVDAGGHLVAAARMDGAPFITPQVALGKAWTAAAYAHPSAAMPAAANTSAKRSRYISLTAENPCAITTVGDGPAAPSGV